MHGGMDRESAVRRASERLPHPTDSPNPSSPSPPFTLVAPSCHSASMQRLRSTTARRKSPALRPWPLVTNAGAQQLGHVTGT